MPSLWPETLTGKEVAIIFVKSDFGEVLVDCSRRVSTLPFTETQVKDRTCLPRPSTWAHPHCWGSESRIDCKIVITNVIPETLC